MTLGVFRPSEDLDFLLSSVNNVNLYSGGLRLLCSTIEGNSVLHLKHAFVWLFNKHYIAAFLRLGTAQFEKMKTHRKTIKSSAAITSIASFKSI